MKRSEPALSTSDSGREPAPWAELLLRLSDPVVQIRHGVHQIQATAVLAYRPPGGGAPAPASRPYPIITPLYPVKATDLHWYLESYYRWPAGPFRERARRIEAQLPHWGRHLYQTVLETEAPREVLTAWRRAAGAHCLSVTVARSGGSDGAAAGELLGLPWELLHDGRSYLLQAGWRVRRRLEPAAAPPRLLRPLRILSVNPRPEHAHIPARDHRLSSLPLLRALRPLENQTELTILTPATWSALTQALHQAQAAEQPFQVIHLDGFGFHDRRYGLEGVGFEAFQDSRRPLRPAMHLVYAGQLAELLGGQQVGQVFLSLRRHSPDAEEVSPVLAAKLVEAGVGTVVVLSYDLLAEAAERFYHLFYSGLLQGATPGEALLAGQQRLLKDSYRAAAPGAGALHLQDWFVPRVYQSPQDPKPLARPAAPAPATARVRSSPGEFLPAPPPQRFIGRSRELLALERLLQEHPYGMVHGPRGAGKTTLAAELARWQMASGRYRQAAYIRIAVGSDARTTLESLGRQLLPEQTHWSVLHQPHLKRALQPLSRVLDKHPTLIILDDLESIAADHAGEPATTLAIEELFQACRDLLRSAPLTRLLLLSRAPLPAPFDRPDQALQLGALDAQDAIALVNQVLAREGLVPNLMDSGATGQELVALVEAVDCQPRALLLLAREVSTQGVRAATRDMGRLPAAPQGALYAWVELALRRLAPPTRQWLKPLGVFRGGAQLSVLAEVLGTDESRIERLAQELIQAGLADAMGYRHLRLDPTLGPYLWQALNGHERQQAEQRWIAGMLRLADMLYEQQFKDPRPAAQLTLLELPNLLALLERLQQDPAQRLLGLAGKLEQLLAPLDRPQALARVVALREQTAQDSAVWNAARFEAQRLGIERQLDAGARAAAHNAAQALVQRCLEAGEEAYPGAAYDTARAYLQRAKLHKAGGALADALPDLAQARRRFQALADTGNASAARMAYAVSAESGDCLRDLGRLEEAAAVYEALQQQAEPPADPRIVANLLSRLGSVRLLQGRLEDALALCREALGRFEASGELGQAAELWQKIGMVHRHAQRFADAEQAYRQAMAAWTALQNRAQEAVALTELGLLYSALERLAEAADCHGRAAAIYQALHSLKEEGFACDRLATALLRQGRYPEARRTLQRAVACKEPYGQGAEPWLTWGLLHALEQAAGQPRAARRAWRRAVRSYLAYRRAGHRSLNPDSQLCAQVAQAISAAATAALAQTFAELARQDDVPDARKGLLSKLQAILAGARDSTLADDPALDYADAVELRLLLETLSPNAADVP